MTSAGHRFRQRKHRRRLVTILRRRDCMYLRVGWVGLTVWYRGAVSLIWRGDVWVQFVLGDWWEPQPEYRRAGDWSRSYGRLHVVGGDWWLASR